jgi:hypothetical protein
LVDTEASRDNFGTVEIQVPELLSSSHKEEAAGFAEAVSALAVGARID